MEALWVAGSLQSRRQALSHCNSHYNATNEDADPWSYTNELYDFGKIIEPLWADEKTEVLYAYQRGPGAQGCVRADVLFHDALRSGAGIILSWIMAQRNFCHLNQHRMAHLCARCCTY